MPKQKINRSEAVELLCHLIVPQLSDEDKLSHVFGFWSIDDADPEYHTLSDELKRDMSQGELPERYEDKYSALVLWSLIYGYIGVKNEYIAARLLALTGTEYDIVGEVENLEQCPCCGFKTIGERGNYDVCPVCFWEDDGYPGLDDLDKYSGPNRNTLREARKAFAEVGAVSVGSIPFVDKDGPLKYYN